MSRNILNNLVGNTSFKDRIIHNAMLMNTHKNRAWLAKLIKLGWIHIGSIRTVDITTATANLFAIMDVFERHYGDRADLNIYSIGYGNYCLEYRVYYPIIEISNSEGRKHTIRDLLVVHPLFFRAEGKIVPQRMQGLRLSVSDIELHCGYKHSHLPSKNKDRFAKSPFETSHFCVGGDTDLYRMEQEFTFELNIDRFELYLFTVDSMLQWESLEGVPHMKMADILPENLKTINRVDSRTGDLASLLIRDRKPLKFDFYVEGDKYRIKQNQKASDFIKDWMVERGMTSLMAEVLCVRWRNSSTYVGLGGNQMPDNPVVHKTSSGENPYILFNGVKKEVKIRITNQKDVKKITVEDCIIYPPTLKLIINEFEERIFKKDTSNRVTKALNTIRNARSSSTSNQISL